MEGVAGSIPAGFLGDRSSVVEHLEFDDIAA